MQVKMQYENLIIKLIARPKISACVQEILKLNPIEPLSKNTEKSSKRKVESA